MRLQSHYEPNLLLKTHIVQVQKAVDFLLSCHSDVGGNSSAMLQAIVKCHDLGKGSRAFQAYIRNPSEYVGDSRSKSHAVLSGVLAILWADRHNWDALDILVLAQSVVCHHSGFKTLADLELSLELDFDDPLEEQYEDLDLNLLAETCGLDLDDIENDDFEAARRCLFKRHKLEKKLGGLGEEEAIGFRVWAQFCFAVLLEADKALLACSEDGAGVYFHKPVWVKSPSCVDDYLRTVVPSDLAEFRCVIQSQVMRNLMRIRQTCLTLTLPTGAGKTLLAARWALTLREEVRVSGCGVVPKIVVVLPFLSIIEQTDKIYRKLLGVGSDRASTEMLMASHSLSYRSFELEGGVGRGGSLSNEYVEFFLNTWRSEVVITTFDQFLLAIFSDKTRHLMRFHHLLDALIVLDEVQTLPPRLWHIVNQILQALTREGSSRVLMMSATQPLFLSPAEELVGTFEDVERIFKQCERYRIHLNHRVEQFLEDFTSELIGRVEVWLEENKRVMITLNTRLSAKFVWRRLNEVFGEQVRVHLISADITPRDRFRKIENVLDCIRNDCACIVVSTQTVEAGVDIDMDVVIRDFAPLDKIVQVAGRCNRNNHRGKHGGYVEVVSLLSVKGKKFAEMIYDKVLLGATVEILSDYELICEEDILGVSNSYFELLHKNMNIGKELTRQFAYWEELDESVHALLRNRQGGQVNFVVLDDDDGMSLRSEIELALKIKDRWERRTALQALAGKVNERSVNVYERRGFHPDDYAELLGYFWILKAGFYSEDSGLYLKFDEEEEDSVCIF